MIGKPSKLKFYNPKNLIIPEEPKDKEIEKEESEEEEIDRTKFNTEIDMINKYLTLEFKTTDFSSQILLDALSNQGWVKLINSLHRITRCHLLWLSRDSSHIYNNERLLNKVHIVNKIENLDNLLQSGCFNDSLNVFLSSFYEEIVILHL